MRGLAVLLVACAALGAGCNPIDLPVRLVTGPQRTPFDCDDCNDRAISGHTTDDLARRAADAAARGDCVCAYALVNATALKNPAVRDAVIHEEHVRACLPDEPTRRRAVLAAAGSDGMIARCLANEHTDVSSAR